MKTAHIIYRNFLSPDGNRMSIGGIQTYLTNLSLVLNDLEYHVCIYHRGDVDFHKQLSEHLDVYGYARPIEKVRGLNSMLYSRVKPHIQPERGDILIFGCESMASKTDKSVPVFAVQHGISWDIPQLGLSRWKYAFLYLKKQYRAWVTTQRIKNADHLICVDCNFINWYKALVPCPEVKLHYIPNFSAIREDLADKPDSIEGVNIIFARRFEPQRGTRLFMTVAKRLLAEYDSVHITIAGEGSDEKLLKENLESHPRVKFVRYDSCESLAIHSKNHIAVVPTLGSEGTSLSLLEAMAAGCAIVCTNVGGMTNVIINGYNGLMISPEEEELYQAVKRLIENEEERKLLASRGKESLRTSFSLIKWQTAWKKILRQSIS